MNRFITLWLCFLFLTCVSVSAQELKVDKVTLLEADDEAVTNPRYDGNGEICALLKVYVNDMPGLKFASSFVIDGGNIIYQGGYYAVYVANGIRNMMLRHGDYLPVTMNFRRDFQISIKGGKTYRIDVSTIGMVKKTAQTVAFNMIPREGSLLINGEKHSISEGMLQLELAPGDYSYIASADYYHKKEGTLRIKEEEITEVKELPISLKPMMANVNFTCNVPTAKLYVKNAEKGGPGIKSLPMGKHRIRVKAKDWKDFTKEIIIDKAEGQELSVTMQPKSIVSIVVIVHGITKPLLYIDNQEVKGWSNGEPFGVKLGKHLITVLDGERVIYDLGSEMIYTKFWEDDVKVIPNMEPIHIYPKKKKR